MLGTCSNRSNICLWDRCPGISASPMAWARFLWRFQGHGEEWEKNKKGMLNFNILQHTSICLFHLLRNKIAGCVAVLEKGLTMRCREKWKFKTSRWSIVHCEAAFVTCWWVCLASTASASGPSRSALKCWTTKTQKSLVPEVLQISSWQNMTKSAWESKLSARLHVGDPIDRSHVMAACSCEVHSHNHLPQLTKGKSLHLLSVCLCCLLFAFYLPSIYRDEMRQNSTACGEMISTHSSVDMI